MHLTALRMALLALHIADSAGGCAQLPPRSARVLLRAGLCTETRPGSYRLTKLGRESDPNRPPVPALESSDHLALEVVHGGPVSCVACGAECTPPELAATIVREPMPLDEPERDTVCLVCARRMLTDRLDAPASWPMDGVHDSRPTAAPDNDPQPRRTFAS